jgi:transposase
MSSLLSMRPSRQETPDRRRGIVIGIDVAKGKMDYAAFRPSEKSGVLRVKRNSEGFASLLACAEALKATGYEVWMAYEPTGPYSYCLSQMLLRSEFRTVLVNPYHVKRTKEVRDNTPQKSDMKDPGVIADLVWQGCYQEVANVEGLYSDLRYAYWDWVSLGKQMAHYRNEYQSVLEMWFPELGDIFVDPLCKSARAIVKRYQSVEGLGQARSSSVKRLVRKASSGRVSASRARDIHQSARDSVGAREGAISLNCHLRRIVSAVEEIERQKEELRGRMEGFLNQLPEAANLLTVPFVGTITVAGFLGECGDISKFGCYAQLEKHLGLNLYEVSSGKHKGGRRISKRGRCRGRYLLCLAGIMQMRNGGLFHEYAQSRKSEKMPSKTIMIATERKLLRLLYAIARDGSTFDARSSVTEGTRDGLSIRQGAQPRAA